MGWTVCPITIPGFLVGLGTSTVMSDGAGLAPRFPAGACSMPGHTGGGNFGTDTCAAGNDSADAFCAGGGFGNAWGNACAGGAGGDALGDAWGDAFNA
eukprot:3497649-Alexandrium_andersonii.AAC.1